MMNATRILDEELLPIDMQLLLIEKTYMQLPVSQRKLIHEQLARLNRRLNQAFSRNKLSVWDYMDLSIKLRKQRIALSH